MRDCPTLHLYTGLTILHQIKCICTLLSFENGWTSYINNIVGLNSPFCHFPTVHIDHTLSNKTRHIKCIHNLRDFRMKENYAMSSRYRNLKSNPTAKPLPSILMFDVQLSCQTPLRVSKLEVQPYSQTTTKYINVWCPTVLSNPTKGIEAWSPTLQPNHYQVY
jgi:hypothetical protein